MAEAIRTAKLASKILDELANFLKWEINSENDLNFNKILKISHFKTIKMADCYKW